VRACAGDRQLRLLHLQPVQYLGELGAELEVVRNDQADVEELLGRGVDRVVVSPGPCTPVQAGSHSRSCALPAGRHPTLGVCLGHQALAQAFGGAVIRHQPVHGKTGVIEHDGRSVYRGLPSPLVVGRYHSLIVAEELPDCLEVSARGEGVVMASATASCRRRASSSTPSRS